MARGRTLGGSGRWASQQARDAPLVAGREEERRRKKREKKRKEKKKRWVIKPEGIWDKCFE